MMSNIEDTNSSSLIDENVLAFELSEEAVFGVPLTNRTESEDNLPNTESLAETNDLPQQQETDSLLSISQSESDPSNSKLPKSKTPSRAVLAPDVTHVPIQPLDIVEYEWPCKSGDKFFLQEQISELLGINSFKRKYPELVRRTVEPAERDYLLKELKTNIALPSHHLTALHSVDVRELMSSEYPFEYAEYQKVCNERVKRSLLEKQKEMETIKLDARKMAEIRQKAVKSASEFNSELQFVRRTERQHFWEMNTNLVHSPLNKWMRLSAEHTKPSEFPVLLMPGQFTTYYKRFDSALLRSFPFGSVVKSDDLFRPKRDASPPAISISEKELEAAKSYNDTTNEQNSNNSNDKNGRKEHTFLDVDMEQLERNAMPKISQKEREMEQPPTKARKMSVTSTSSKVSISWTSSSVSKMALQKANATEVNKPRGYLQPQQQQKQGESEQKPGICSVCKSTEPSPAHKTSLLVRCSACRHQMHSSCIDMPLNMVEVIRKYDWLCIECKRCSVCEQPDQEAAMMCCDACDRGYHTFCIGVEMPPNGTWHCPKCKGTIMDEQLRKRYLSVKEPEQLMEGQQKVLYMDLESKPHEEFDGTFEMPQKKRKGRPPNKKT